MNNKIKKGANMVYDYSKLEGKIIEKFGTRENFAKSLGVTTKSISEKPYRDWETIGRAHV